MQIKQKTYMEVEKDGKLVQLVVDADLSLGLIFDALMEMKGFCVDKMTATHQSELEEAEEKMGSPEKEVKEEE